MEKVIKGKTFVFKNELLLFEMNEFYRMRNRLERSNAIMNDHNLDYEQIKKQEYTEMDFLFDTFPIFCISIDGKDSKAEDKRKYIMNISDLEIVDAISEVIMEVVEKAKKSISQKKKMT